MYFLYILKSEKNGSYYIGSCENMDIRLSMHNTGLVKSTIRYIPWRIVYHESYPSLRLVRNRELQIKLWKSRKAIERLFDNRKI